MKAHKYWSVGALITMLGTFYTGYKKQKSSHKYFALSSMLCMVMAIYTGHKMITGNRKKKANKEKDTERLSDCIYGVVSFLFERNAFGRRIKLFV